MLLDTVLSVLFLTASGTLALPQVSPSDCDLPSCVQDVQSANLFLKSIHALVGTESFTGIGVNSEAECTSVLSQLNGVAAENAVADQRPFPLNAPFPVIDN